MQGSNGEYVYLSTEERVEIVDFVKRESPEDRLIIAGSGCEGILNKMNSVVDFEICKLEIVFSF